ncbi:MAG: two-component system response regulator [Flavobacteriaceae bacterium]|nr:MAG: two-component system response regulator [Flavobacteriaceae bacterium]
MSVRILWIDDEIDMLKSHIIFLEKKGFITTPHNNPDQILERIGQNNFDVILLDENMPGQSGLDTLQIIKDRYPYLPVIMVTKSEEEQIMEEAIGAHISDYLIKPVNPNQIVLSIKKVLDSNKIISDKSVSSYQQTFGELSYQMMQTNSFPQWMELFNRLVKIEVSFDSTTDQGMIEILNTQKEEANTLFSKYIEKNYLQDLAQGEIAFSHTVFKRFVIPKLKKNNPTIFLMIDNLRLDQWQSMQDLFAEYYHIENTELFSSILPTATQYSRNAIFAGLTPLDIQKKYPQYWLNDDQDGPKNQFEEELLTEQLKRNSLENLSTAYYKISNIYQEEKLLQEFHHFKNNDLTTIVYNFIDILSHSKTDNQLIKEMIRDDKTFRSLTRNWFENSPLLKIIALASSAKINLIITTDHGTTMVKTPSKIIGDRETSTNIRYKMGKNLKYESKKILVADVPEAFYLPKSNLSSKYVFAKEDIFLAYPKNYNHFVNYYKDTYQHGGISLEEMVIPIINLLPKS